MAGEAGRTGARGFRVPLKGQVIELTETLTLLADLGAGNYKARQIIVKPFLVYCVFYLCRY